MVPFQGTFFWGGVDEALLFSRFLLQSSKKIPEINCKIQANIIIKDNPIPSIKGSHSTNGQPLNYEVSTISVDPLNMAVYLPTKNNTKKNDTKSTIHIDMYIYRYLNILYIFIYKDIYIYIHINLGKYTICPLSHGIRLTQSLMSPAVKSQLSGLGNLEDEILRKSTIQKRRKPQTIRNQREEIQMFVFFSAHLLLLLRPYFWEYCNKFCHGLIEF